MSLAIASHRQSHTDVRVSRSWTNVYQESNYTAIGTTRGDLTQHLLQRLDKLEQHLSHGFRSVHSHQASATLEVLKHLDHNFPRYFVLLPDKWFRNRKVKRLWKLKRKSIFSKRWRVLLICEGGSGIHDWHLQEAHEGYTVKINKEWLRKALPYLKVGFKVLSLATRVLSSLDFGFLEGVFENHAPLWKLLEDFCSGVSVSSENLQKKDLSDLVSKCMSQDNSRLLEALLLQSDDFNKLKETPGEVGGLRQIVRDDLEHRVVWLCDKCATIAIPSTGALSYTHAYQAPAAAPLLDRQASSNTQQLTAVLEPGKFRGLSSVVQALRDHDFAPSDLTELSNDDLREIFPSSVGTRKKVLQIAKDMLSMSHIQKGLDSFASSFLTECIPFLNASAYVSFSARKLLQSTFDARILVNLNDNVKLEISASHSLSMFDRQAGPNSLKHRLLAKHEQLSAGSGDLETQFCLDMMKSGPSKANLEVLHVSWKNSSGGSNPGERGQFFAGVDTTQLLENILHDSGALNEHTEIKLQHGPRGMLPSLTGINMNMLQSCLFARSTVVVSELLTSLPNLTELSCVSCVNVFDESQLSGVRSWYVFSELSEDMYTTSYPPLPDTDHLHADRGHDEDKSSHEAQIEELHEASEDITGDTNDATEHIPNSEPRADTEDSRPDVVKTRTIAAVPLAVWSRAPISKDFASRFKRLPMRSADQRSGISPNDSEFIDALGFYDDQQVFQLTRHYLRGVFSMLNEDDKSATVKLSRVCSFLVMCDEPWTQSLKESERKGHFMTLFRDSLGTAKIAYEHDFIALAQQQQWTLTERSVYNAGLQLFSEQQSMQEEDFRKQYLRFIFHVVDQDDDGRITVTQVVQCIRQRTLVGNEAAFIKVFQKHGSIMEKRQFLAIDLNVNWPFFNSIEYYSEDIYDDDSEDDSEVLYDDPGAQAPYDSDRDRFKGIPKHYPYRSDDYVTIAPRESEDDSEDDSIYDSDNTEEQTPYDRVGMHSSVRNPDYTKMSDAAEDRESQDTRGRNSPATAQASSGMSERFSATVPRESILRPSMSPPEDDHLPLEIEDLPFDGRVSSAQRRREPEQSEHRADDVESSEQPSDDETPVSFAEAQSITQNIHEPELSEHPVDELESSEQPPDDETPISLAEAQTYTCLFCEETFKKKWNRDTHMNSHIGRRPYKCALCDEGFPHQSKFERHVKTRHNVQCPMCDKTVVNMDDLPAHLKSAHPDRKPKAVAIRTFRTDCCNIHFSSYKARKDHEESCAVILERRAMLAKARR